jgi:hypothetical protein
MEDIGTQKNRKKDERKAKGRMRKNKKKGIEERE